MKTIRLETFSYRFAEQVLNGQLALKQELEDILLDTGPLLPSLSRPEYNRVLDDHFVAKGWERQPAVFDEKGDPTAKIDFLKSRVGIEVQFGHSSFIGIDLLKFQVASYSGLDKIDVGVYVTTTKKFKKYLISEFGQKWEGSLDFEKVVRYLPHFKSAIQVPVYVIGITV